MGDFSDDYGGYDILGLYEQREDERRAQRAKLLTPPRRAWVGLTDDQLADLWYKQSLDWMEFARAHEAALRSKNFG
jgi:hypothetical protein